MNPETELLTTTHYEDLSQIYACQHAHKYLPLSSSHQVGLTDGSTVSCDQSSAACQAYLAKYCHSKPSIDLWKPYLQSPTQSVLKRASLSRRRQQLANIQQYHVTRTSWCYSSKFENPNHKSSSLANSRYITYVSSVRMEQNHNQTVSDSANRRSVQTLSNFSVRQQHHNFPSKTQTSKNVPQKCQLHQTVSKPNMGQRRHTITNKSQTSTDGPEKCQPHQSVLKEQQLLIQQINNHHEVNAAEKQKDEELESNRRNEQFNKRMRERRLRYLLLLNQQISAEEKIQSSLCNY